MKLVKNAPTGLALGIKTLVALVLLGSLSTDRGGPEQAA
jgi:hypothetical protein